MSTTYPSTKQTFTNPTSTSIQNSPSHSFQHITENDTIVAIEDVIGTTAGTSVLKNFAAGDFAVRINSSNVLQQTLSGTVNNSIFGTPSLTGGTSTSQVINQATLGSPTITGGTVNSLNVFNHSGTADSYFTGNLGIGVSTPSANFQVGTNVAFTGARVKIIGWATNAGTDANLEIGDGNTVYWKTARNSSNTFQTDVSSSWSIISPKLGIGTTTPTAILHIKAGGTAVNSAPIKLTAGVLNTAAETGAVEYDGTALYFTDLGTTRQTITFNNGTQTLTYKTINNATIGTPSITGGTSTSHVINNPTVGTPSITGGTLASVIINNMTAGTPLITGGTANLTLLGTPTFVLGSDAGGDIFYRSAGGTVTRLGIGGTGEVLTVSSGTLPYWAAPSGGTASGITSLVVGAGLTGGTITSTGTITAKSQFLQVQVFS